MTRLFLAAGVAALAIATPLAAKPGGGGGGDHGNGGGAPAAAPNGGGGGHGHGNGGGGGAPAAAPNGGGGGHGHGNGGGGGGPAAVMGGGGGGGGHRGGGGAPVSMGGGGRGNGGGFAAPQMQRVERQQARAVQHQQARGFELQQARVVQHQQARGFERQQARAVQHQQARGFERQQARAVEKQRGFERQQASNSARQARGIERQQLRGSAIGKVQQQAIAQQQLNAQGLGGRGAFRDKAQFAKNQQLALQSWNDPRNAAISYGARSQYLPAAQVEQFVGQPISALTGYAAFSPLPVSVQYLYPPTPDYYYQYGNGYAYQIDRSTSLIDALIPLFAGGYLPGQYLPQPYMASYVPDYYGFNSFYPDYGNTCNRYYNGVVYQVDCASGYVDNVIPTYAGGYGVGQMLPSAYNYYNVPMQYRDLYYDTPDYNYWYAPGAIYQYDPRSSMITSVASLLSPGFSIGQQLPMGYGAYNVPYDYRQTYYDTPDAWYRYNNGNIYQVDPATQLVTAIVASLLT